MIKLKSLILNEDVSNKTIINVDIQPEYQRIFSFKIYEFTEFINENFHKFSNVIFLYNGRDTVGELSEYEYKDWLVENGLNPEYIDSCRFYDKGYAFFRYCMDRGADQNSIVNFVKFLYENDIRDSREMTRELWVKYLKLHRKTDKKEIYNLIKHSEDCIYIPDLMDYLRSFRNNILLTGGGIHECLKEVEIALLALNYNYTIYNEFTY